MRTVTGLAWRMALFAGEIRSATSLRCALTPRAFNREIAVATSAHRP